MVKVSVVIPFYNRIDWTKEAINSVLSQTFQDFEIIVIDDGSEEEYKSEIEELDSRIIYLRQENRGVSAARNVGIRHSSGEFIAFLDSDDLFLPEKLQIQISVMEEHPNILLSHTSYNQVDHRRDLLQVIHSGSFTGNVYPEILALCPIATPTVMLRRALLGSLEFCEEIRIGEDLLLWSQISKRSAIIGIDIPLTNVRIHGKNAAMDSEKHLERLSNIAKYGLDQDFSLSVHDWKAVLHNITASLFPSDALPEEPHLNPYQIWSRAYFAASFYCRNKPFRKLKYFLLALLYDPKFVAVTIYWESVDILHRINVSIIRFGTNLLRTVLPEKTFNALRARRRDLGKTKP